jgi:hypothetical protein
MSILDDDSYISDDGDTNADADLCAWCECRRDSHDDSEGECNGCNVCRRFINE